MYWVSASTSEELHRVRAPSGNVAGELFQDQHGAFAAAERDGVRHLGARTGDGGGDAVDELIADEVADVGNDPGAQVSMN